MFTSIYSGLRIYNIKNLSWKDILEEPDGFRIVIRQQKTKNYVRIPLAENGVEYLGTRKGDNDLVFPTLEKSQKL
jgi:integrase